MTADLKGFTPGIVTHYQQWTEHEFSIQVKANIAPYQAGQFTKLALKDQAGKWLRRAYSFVNSPNHDLGPDVMEFLIIDVPNGGLSPRLAKLQLGDEIYVGETASGFMTLNEIPERVSDLWLLSTGTAIGPFLSILAEPECQQRFSKLVLVHAVRTRQELVYQELIAKLQHEYRGNLIYLPIVSREQHPDIISDRIPNLLSDGRLMQAVNLNASKTSSFFYLCGNPDMVRDTRAVLSKLGFEKHLRRSPGHFSSENYW
ncbi:ferredoxin--NADP+ reductase [Colwellia chukchiensis]|uniref:ferredoxin--NADP(+) reductase n=1 Tax=Colwellia chukchiensis TaxID=641665 RepID=A0A1H7MTN0_9GAMM|nr:ferredoxin--NADP reductase [Colwellia chukchiensis]SEL14622.1 ferredoxin--NADP+ reductase [Colwellia chukchiensis]